MTEEQWTLAKGPLVAPEPLRAAIQVQLEGIHLGLQMPTPDANVLARYEKKMKVLLANWRKQYRSLWVLLVD